MAEYIDLYNAAREPLNRVWQRGVPLPEGAWRLGVRVWIGNSSGQYLISQRNPNLYSHPLFWESTGGGVSAGETSRTAAVRELYEELGISTQEDAILFLNTELVSRGPEFLDNYYLQCDAALSELRLQPEEVNDARWASLQEIQALIEQGVFYGTIDPLNRIPDVTVQPTAEQ